MVSELMATRVRLALDNCAIEGYAVHPWGCMPLDEDEVCRVRQMMAHASESGRLALANLIKINDEILHKIGRRN